MRPIETLGTAVVLCILMFSMAMFFIGDDISRNFVLEEVRNGTVKAKTEHNAEVIRQWEVERQMHLLGCVTLDCLRGGFRAFFILAIYHT